MLPGPCTTQTGVTVGVGDGVPVMVGVMVGVSVGVNVGVTVGVMVGVGVCVAKIDMTASGAEQPVRKSRMTTKASKVRFIGSFLIKINRNHR